MSLSGRTGHVRDHWTHGGTSGAIWDRAVISEQHRHAVGRTVGNREIDQPLGVVGGPTLPRKDVRDLILAHRARQTVRAEQQAICRPQLYMFNRDLRCVCSDAECIGTRARAVRRCWLRPHAVCAPRGARGAALPRRR